MPSIAGDPMKQENVDSMINAARQGHNDKVTSLLDFGVDINSTDAGNKTPLLHAACKGRSSTVAMLLDSGADVDRRDNYGGTPLFWAVCTAQFAVVKLLVEHGAEMSSGEAGGQSPFLRAASGLSKPAHADILAYFIRMGADVNEADHNGLTGLMFAAMGGYEELMRILLAGGVDVHRRSALGETALVMACRSGQDGQAGVVRLLVDHGAELSVRDQHKQPLHYLAAESGDPMVVTFLLDQGLDPNEDGGRVLRAACRHGGLEVVRVLLGKGADVNLADAEGITPLMIQWPDDTTGWPWNCSGPEQM